MTSPGISSGRTQMVAMEEIPRYELLFSKALSFQHLEKDFTQVILSWAQPKLCTSASSALGSPSSLVCSVLNEALGTT